MSSLGDLCWKAQSSQEIQELRKEPKLATDPPPLKWSVLKYGLGPEEDRNDEEETHA
jgi:hypothetical protein